MGYLINVALGLDYFASCLTGGKPGTTLSGRAGSAYLQGKLRGRIFAPCINFLMQNPAALPERGPRRHPPGAGGNPRSRRDSVNAIELRAITYLLGALGFMYLGGHLAGLHYEALIAKDHAAIANLAAQAAVAAKAKEDLANSNNATVVVGLQSQLDNANAAAADFAYRLRDAEARSRQLPKGGDKPGTPATAPQGSSDSLTGLLTAAAAECFDNEARQDALIKELKPQL